MTLEILRLLVQLLTSLAWPILLGVALYIFKKPLIERLDTISRLKTNFFEAEFDRNIKAAEEASQKALPESTKVDKSKSGYTDNQLQSIRISPANAIIQAWNDVEIAAFVAARRSGIEHRLWFKDSMAKELENIGLLNADQVNLFNYLRNIRNNTIHLDIPGKSIISPADAFMFIKLADQLIVHLQKS